MSRYSFTKLVVSVAVATGLAVGGLGSPAGASTNSGGIPTWAADFMTNGSGKPTYDPGLTLALRQAGAFDVIAAHQYTYNDYVSQMKAANPDLVLLVYLNGTFSGSQSPDAYPDSWYARDSAGDKIQALSFGTWLMNPSNPAWISEVVRLCTTRLAYSGYDGCFVDVLGTSGINPLSVTGIAINPATGQEWTRAEWLDATENIGAQVRAAIAPLPVFGNGLSNGSPYFNTDGPTERILDGLDGGMSEVFVRPATSPVNSYKKESAWKKDVDMLLDAAARPSGNAVIAVTKVWTTATAAQQDAWHRYSLATFLLGYQPGHAFFTFRIDKSLTPPSPYWDVNIGDPAGAYAKAGGVYQREFTNGKVLVNPTTTAVTVALGGSYKTLDGTTVTTVTLQPRTGEVLTRV